MTTPKGPSKPGGGAPGATAGRPGAAKPFLGDDDLSELDAWVETFDALHGGPEPGTEPGAVKVAPTSTDTACFTRAAPVAGSPSRQATKT